MPITQKVLEIYEMHHRGEWEGPDFPYKFFTKIYPDKEEKKNQLFEEENRVESRGSVVSVFNCRYR